MTAYKIKTYFNKDIIIIATTIESAIKLFKEAYPCDPMIEIKLVTNYTLVEKSREYCTHCKIKSRTRKGKGYIIEYE